MNWLLNFLLNNSHFPKVTDVEAELKKAAILRIILGVVIFIRYSEIAWSLNLYYDSGYLGPSIYMLVLITCFTFGFLTPLITLLLMSSLCWFDLLSTTSNLGTGVLFSTLLIFLLINQGTFYSIDHLILKKRGFFTWLVRKLYTLAGTPSKEDITKAYLLGFIIYALISFGALLFHIKDSYWVGGLTVQSLLTSAYLSKHYLFFRWLESTFPLALGLLSVTAGIFQSIFQFLMIPLILFKIGRKFVFTWGLIFILVSLFCINLSYLPHVELVFWVFIFLPSGKVSEKISTFNIGTYRIGFFKWFYNFYGIILALLIILTFPIISNRIRDTRIFNNKEVAAFPKHFKRFITPIGLGLPDVFNKVDLSMGNHWMVLYRLNKNNIWELVPITGLDGCRLNYWNFDVLYFTNHNTDFLYFGNTLQYSRKILEADDVALFHEGIDEYGRENIERRIRYDYKYMRYTRNIVYKIEVFESKSSEVTLFKSNPSRHIPLLIYAKQFCYDGQSLLEK